MKKGPKEEMSRDKKLAQIGIMATGSVQAIAVGALIAAFGCEWFWAGLLVIAVGAIFLIRALVDFKKMPNKPVDRSASNFPT